MTFDDLRKLATRQTLFKLDTVLAPRLVPILYALGLGGVLLWAVSHLFARFDTGFGNGLWGLLEIAVFGLLAVIALRIVCEALLVYFKSHEAASDTLERKRLASNSLLDEVREAIRDLADEGDNSVDPYVDYTDAENYIVPDDDFEEDLAEEQPAKVRPVRRTARRMPKEKL